MESSNQFRFNDNLVSGGYQMQKYQETQKNDIKLVNAGKIGFGTLKDHVVKESKNQSFLSRVVTRAFPALGRLFENYNRTVKNYTAEGGYELSTGHDIRDQIKGHTTHLKEVTRQIKDAKKEIRELDKTIRTAVTFDTATDKAQVTKLVEKRNDLIGQLVGFRQNWLNVKNQLNEMRRGAEGTFLQGASVMVQLGRTEKKLDQTFQYFSAGLLRSETSYRFQNLKDNINGYVAAMVTTRSLQEMGLATNMSTQHLKPIREEVNKMISLRNQAIQEEDTAAVAQIDSFLAGLPPECTQHIRETSNALPSRILEFDKPGTVMTDETRQAIGSQGLTTNYDGTVAVSHESYGTADDKEVKQGRNCDRAFGEKTTEGNFRFGVFDGSREKAKALKTASACMSYSHEAMRQGALSHATSKDACAEAGKKMFGESIDPTHNPSIMKALQQTDESSLQAGLPNRDNGETTAIVLDTQKTAQGTVLVRGAAAGDCSAFAIGRKVCKPLYKEPSLWEEGVGKDVSDTPLQLSTPRINDRGQVEPGRFSGPGQVEGIYEEVDSGTILIAASDALTDNINKNELEAIIQFIASNSAFDAIPTDPPAYVLYTPPPTEENLQTLHKPTLQELRDSFAETSSEEAPLDPSIVAQRLNNYVAWISETHKKNMEVIQRAIANNELTKGAPNYQSTLEPLVKLFKKAQTGKLDDATVVAVQV